MRLAPTAQREPRTERRRGAWLLQVYVACAAVGFGALTLLALSTPHLGVDLAVGRAAQANRSGWLDALTGALSWIGFAPQAHVLFGGIILALLVAGHRREAGGALFAGAGSGALWSLVTPLIDRPRPSPDLVHVTTQLPDGSFPSGHVLTTTAFFGFIVFLALAQLRPRWARWLVLLVFAPLLVGIGFARVYAGEHWPSDVLGGYLLGSLWLALSIHVYRWLGRRRGPHHKAVSTTRTQPSSAPDSHAAH